MKIALIDDNKTILKINEVMLKKENHINENDKIEVFEEIKDLSQDTINYFVNEFDLIVCDQDLGVGKVNGLDFLKKVIEVEPNKYCVLLTGNDSLLMKAKTAISKNINYLIKNNDKNGGTIFKLGEIISKVRKEA